MREREREREREILEIETKIRNGMLLTVETVAAPDLQQRVPSELQQ